ncbi:hypothetical protein D3C77_294770 [compost metagenome]
MDTNKMREQFEVAFARYAAMSVDEVKAHWDGDLYDDQGMRDAIWAWDESRKTVVVELPPIPAKPEDPEFALDDSHMDAYNAAVRMRDACVKAIEAQGLKVVS